jgi:hypothetical protein
LKEINVARGNVTGDIQRLCSIGKRRSGGKLCGEEKVVQRDRSGVIRWEEVVKVADRISLRVVEDQQALVPVPASFSQ